MIDHITNSTGTILNRYTMDKEDGSQETVKLTFSPSDDYVKGTSFDEDSINPIIDEINTEISALETTATNLDTRATALETKVGNYSLWVGTQSEYNAITTKDANTIYHILES